MLFRCASVLAASLATACPAAAAATADPTDTAWRVIAQTNDLRAADHLPPTAANRHLAAAAEAFAQYMAKSGNYGHTADGRQPVERAAARGYDHCIVSENIARLYRSTGYGAAKLSQELVNGWSNSPGHRKNMLDAAVTETGVGIAQDPNGRYFAVQMFGRPKASAIRFSVRNDSREKVGYRAGERDFALPPRAERNHTVCRPLELTIALQKPFSASVRNGVRYVVVGGPEGLAVQTRQ